MLSREGGAGNPRSARKPGPDEIEMKTIMTKKLFDGIDGNGNVRLVEEEMKSLFPELGLTLTPDQEATVLKQIDVDGSGEWISMSS